MRAPAPEDFPSRLRSAAVTARVGLWLGICFGVCFLTGLVSHYAQNVSQPVPFPTSPGWGYRVNQGLHVITGAAAVPLLLVKLWTVYPLLFRRFPRDRVRRVGRRGSRARLHRGPGRGGDLPADDRPRQHHAVVSVGVLVPGDALRRCLDRRRRPAAPHRASSCRSSATCCGTTWTARCTTAPQPPAPACYPDVACCGPRGPPRVWRCSRPRGRRCHCCARCRSSA